MPIASTPIQERIARVLAGLELSSNADGVEDHAADSVDMAWEDHLDAADAILRAIREPDQAMAMAGDPDTWPDIWEAMVLASLDEA